jgi:hypothetical protein
MSNLPNDPAERDDDIVAEVRLQLRRNGAMSVAGAVMDKEFALQMIDAARDAVLSFHSRQPQSILVPDSGVKVIQ